MRSRIICSPFWGSFAVSGSFAVGDHLRYCTVLFGDTIFTRDRHFTWSSEPREGLAAYRLKEYLHISVIFKTLSIGPPPGIEPATSRSAVKRSTDCANPARPITIKFRIRKESSKPQTKYHWCLRLSYLAPYWLISCNTITCHKYFWC